MTSSSEINKNDDKDNKRQELGVQKLLTMIEGLDDITHGGLPKGRSTLVSGTSGTGKTLLAMQFLYNGITGLDEHGVFVTFEESPLTSLKMPIVLTGISKN